jgi:hypothetical protein
MWAMITTKAHDLPLIVYIICSPENPAGVAGHQAVELPHAVIAVPKKRVAVPVDGTCSLAFSRFA